MKKRTNKRKELVRLVKRFNDQEMILKLRQKLKLKMQK